MTPNIYQYSNLRFRLKSEIWAFGDVTTDKSQIVIISRCSEICFKISDLSSNLRFKHWFSLVNIGCEHYLSEGVVSGYDRGSGKIWEFRRSTHTPTHTHTHTRVVSG